MDFQGEIGTEILVQHLNFVAQEKEAQRLEAQAEQERIAQEQEKQAMIDKLMRPYDIVTFLLQPDVDKALDEPIREELLDSNSPDVDEVRLCVKGWWNSARTGIGTAELSLNIKSGQHISNQYMAHVTRPLLGSYGTPTDYGFKIYAQPEVDGQSREPSEREAAFFLDILEEARERATLMM